MIPKWKWRQNWWFFSQNLESIVSRNPIRRREEWTTKSMPMNSVGGGWKFRCGLLVVRFESKPSSVILSPGWKSVRLEVSKSPSRHPCLRTRITDIISMTVDSQENDFQQPATAHICERPWIFFSRKTHLRLTNFIHFTWISLSSSVSCASNASRAFYATSPAFCDWKKKNRLVTFGMETNMNLITSAWKHGPRMRRLGDNGGWAKISSNNIRESSFDSKWRWKSKRSHLPALRYDDGYFGFIVGSRRNVLDLPDDK